MLSVEICVKGYIDEEWSEWFEDFLIEHIQGGITILKGQVFDQSALYSLITRLSRLGLPLISVEVADLENEKNPGLGEL